MVKGPTALWVAIGGGDGVAVLPSREVVSAVIDIYLRAGLTLRNAAPG